MNRFSWLIICLVPVLLIGCKPPVPTEKPAIRVAVIGGMTMTGMWPALMKRFEANTGFKVEVVATGPKQILSGVFRQGKADLLTMHSSDATTDLVADGYALNMRPWTRNQLVIVGPPSDPAHIKGMKDGAAALRKIAEAKAPFVDCASTGSREVAHKIWTKAGISPQGTWVLKDESAFPQDVVHYAEEHNAYVIVGRIPVIHGKIKSGKMEIMVEDDPDMQRPYIVVEANPKKFPGISINSAGARVLSNYLVSENTKAFLRDFGSQQPGGIPLFHPLNNE